jgi:hypothetical protein
MAFSPSAGAAGVVGTEASCGFLACGTVVAVSVAVVSVPLRAASGGLSLGGSSLDNSAGASAAALGSNNVVIAVFLRAHVVGGSCALPALDVLDWHSLY